MMQALQHSHADWISLSAFYSPAMDSMEEHRRAVGKRIAELRKEKGLTQPQLAFNAGISQPSLWAIEAGKTVEVTARTFIELCRALETTWEHLWEGSPAAGAKDEEELVAIFRRLPPAARLAVLQSARTMQTAFPSPAAPALSVVPRERDEIEHPPEVPTLPQKKTPRKHRG